MYLKLPDPDTIRSYVEYPPIIHKQGLDPESLEVTDFAMSNWSHKVVQQGPPVPLAGVFSHAQLCLTRFPEHSEDQLEQYALSCYLMKRDAVTKTRYVNALRRADKHMKNIYVTNWRAQELGQGVMLEKSDVVVVVSSSCYAVDEEHIGFHIGSHGAQPRHVDDLEHGSTVSALEKIVNTWLSGSLTAHESNAKKYTLHADVV